MPLDLLLVDGERCHAVVVGETIDPSSVAFSRYQRRASS